MSAELTVRPLFGLLGVLEEPRLRCDACRAETFDGTVFAKMLVVVARSVLGQARRATRT